MKKLLFAVVPLLMVASACQVGVSMWTSCSPAADGNPFGTDGEYVLACQGGEWVPIMTIGEYLRIRGGMPTIIGSLPEQPSRIAGGDAHSCARATGSGRVECGSLQSMRHRDLPGVGGDRQPRLQVPVRTRQSLRPACTRTSSRLW